MSTIEGQPYNQPTSSPTTKVTASAAGAALATVVVVLASMLFHVTFPPGFEGAIAIIAGFLLGYFVKERPNAG